MSFETKGQEFFGKVVAALTFAVLYGGAALAAMYLIHYCGPDMRPPVVCECNDR